MTINWDHPAAIKLRKEIVEGIIEDMEKDRWYSNIEWAFNFIKDYEKVHKRRTET